jgi:hypothetical protein
VKRAPTFIGVSVSNHWHEIDSHALARELGSAGATGTGVEYVPWSPAVDFPCGPTKLGGGQQLATFPGAFAAFVAAMREQGVGVLVNVVNWHGCAQRAQSDAWFLAKLAEIDAAVGGDHSGIYLSPVAEPWSNDPTKARRWVELARQFWQGPFVVSGGNDASPSPDFPGAYDLIDVHPCSRARAVGALRLGRPDVLVNTDCTPVASPSAGLATETTRAALEAGGNLLLYNFGGTGIPSDAIAAMGKEIQAP